MNKSELVIALAKKENLTKQKAEEVINTIFDTMSDALLAGQRIEIRGFGSFIVRDYSSYTGRNPKTGESISVAPKKLPFFKVGKELKKIVDN
ncbi:MAG: HU family DNA-binding protein [Deltaproteobacteria bacterium]|nr:MAG: integration host factor subunit beta [Deltaproteobacteria bacterium GWA2_47_9]